LSIIDRLIQIRKEQKLSRKALSAWIGIPESTIYNYESGERKPSVEYMESLHSHLEININWLFTGEGEQYVDRKKRVDLEEITLANLQFLRSYKTLPMETQLLFQRLMANPEAHQQVETLLGIIL